VPSFCCFNPMPWPNVDQKPSKWPYPNHHFNAASGHLLYRSYIDQLVFAEQCGFDWIGIAEDHFTAYSIIPNPNILISVLSQLTSRVKLAILGLPIPLLNPIRVAEEVAMLDVLSNGRVVAGFIRGVPQNYAAYNFSPDESRARFNEASELIKKAWTSPDIFSWKGDYYNYPTVSLWPRPIQTPHPPLIYSANSLESATLAAKHRVTIAAIHLYSRNAIDIMRASIEAYKRQARSDGWDPPADRFFIGVQVCIAQSNQQAEDLFTPALDYQFGILSGTFNEQKRELAKNSSYGYTPIEENPPTYKERMANKIIISGDPKAVIEQIKDLEERLGVGTISLQFQVGNMKNKDVLNGMSLFRDQVLPAFRSAPRDTVLSMKR